MNAVFPVLVLIVIGAMIAVQSTLNSALGRHVGLALFVVVFSVIQTVLALPVLAVWGGPVRWAELVRVPWWQHVGALFGVCILIGLAYGVPKTGTFVAMCSLLVGQMLMGVMIDQFGWFGAEVQPVTLMKIVGLVFLFLGVILIKQ
jgi:transporter family-2 protein